MKECYLVSCKWDKIDTQGAYKITDERLLEIAKGVKVSSGWGIMAEICKRFDKRIKNDTKS